MTKGKIREIGKSQENRGGKSNKNIFLAKRARFLSIIQKLRMIVLEMSVEVHALVPLGSETHFEVYDWRRARIPIRI